HAGLIPLHGFWKREFRDHLREKFFQDQVGGPPLFLLDRKEILPLRSPADLQVLDVDSLPCSESRRCSGRLAYLIERHCFGRSHSFLPHLYLLNREILNHQGQPPWCSQSTDRSKCKTLVFQHLLSRSLESR